jgi:acetyltransferase EpsM
VITVIKVVGMSLWIFGAGGHAKVIVDSCLAAGKIIAGRADDRCKEFENERCLTRPELLELGHPGPWVVAVGSNTARMEIASWLSDQLGSGFANVVHPSSVLSPRIEIGTGTQVGAAVVVNVDSVIGDHIILNSRSVIEHDCVIGDGSHVGPGAIVTGGVRIGKGVFLGAGSVVLPGIKVGAFATVGAGAVVARDVEEGTTVVGVPAYPLQHRQ